MVGDDHGRSIPFSPLPTRPRSAAIEFVRNPRARRYVLRVDRSGSVRVTIPRGGSQEFALRFAHEKRKWIEAQLLRVLAGPQPPRSWGVGTHVWFRGERKPLWLADGYGRLGDEIFAVPADLGDWRPLVEAHLRQLAGAEFPSLVLRQASRHQLPVRKVLVRNQRTRWGSCSRRGTISLNWRLVQAPTLVRDYLIAHELAHLREMNHSRRFWRVVHEMFPEWREAEAWLKQHGRDLLG